MERDFLLSIHSGSSPLLDALFWLSNELATTRFCTVLVLAAAAFWLIRRRRAEALLWVALGISTWVLQKGLKEAIGRPRPDLWVGPVPAPESFAFPSGHALAAVTFYALVARAIALHFPRYSKAAYAGAVGMAFYVGFGRIYLGVHWPSDVLAGWAIGAAQTALGFWFMRRISNVKDDRQPSPQ